MTQALWLLEWLLERWTSIVGTWVPYERSILLGLATLRLLVTILGWTLGLRLAHTWRWSHTLALLLAVILALLGSLLSADLIEHGLKALLLGYNYNPYVMAIGEWEGYMGPTQASEREAWYRVMCGPPPSSTPWWGDPDNQSFCR